MKDSVKSLAEIELDKSTALPSSTELDEIPPCRSLRSKLALQFGVLSGFDIYIQL